MSHNVGFLTKRREKKLREEHEALRAANPLNGHSPVVERTGAGESVGRCEHAIRGTFCPRHGNLDGLLVKREGPGDVWELIEEDELPPRAHREMAPDLAFRQGL